MTLPPAMLDPIKEPARPGRELQRRDPQARDGAVMPAAGANPPDGTRITPPNCSFGGPIESKGALFRLAQNSQPGLCGAFRRLGHRPFRQCSTRLDRALTASFSASRLVAYEHGERA
jgi:hypothetical protein